MKTVLKVIGLLLLGIIAFILIAGIFIDKDYHFERSVTIDAPREIVWNNVSSLSALNSWSPWMERDPQMEHSISGTDGTVGATHSWKGNKDVGSGSQTILELVPQEKVRTGLKFMEPMESEAFAFLNLSDEGNGTKVTWGFDSEYTYPFNTLCLFVDMDKYMDADYSAGLAKLKALSEKQAADAKAAAAAAAAPPAPESK